MNAQPRLDHIVIGASSLQQGVDYVNSTFGVDIPFGGEHDNMGTHNHLMQLGVDVFLEVISINPNAAPPAQPRWYGLDDPHIRKSLEKQPGLLAWVVNTDDLAALCKSASYSLGSPQLVTRGGLSWLFGMPEDGRLLAGGLLPYAIEWHAQSHPARQMADLGCRLESFEIFHHDAEWINSALASLNAVDLVKVNRLGVNEHSFFTVTLDTPNGTVKLQSHRAMQ